MATQITSKNAKLANLGWLNAESGPTVPITIDGKNYIYFPESYYSEGLTVGRGAKDPFGGQTFAGNYIYSPAFLQQGIEQKFIPVTLGQDIASELTKLQSSGDVFYGDDPDNKIQSYLNDTAINISKAKNFDKGYLIPAEDFQSAMKNTSIAESITGQGPAPYAQMLLSNLKEVPTGLVIRNGQKSYASASGQTYTDAGGTFYNYTPGGGGLLNDLGLGGITDLIQDLGPIGQIGLAFATGGLSIPEQLAAQTLYNAAGGATFEDALKGAALNVALTEGVKASGIFGGGTQSNLADVADGDLIPFDEGLTGIDIGDVIPATPAQLEGLYPIGGVFNPPAGTTGIDMGDVIPATEEQLRGLYETQGVFRPEMEGIDMGETIPYTAEQIAGLYPEGGTFMPEGIDVGDTIPYTPDQIAGLYPPGGSFLPEGIDVGDVIPFTPEQVQGLYPPGGTFLPGGYTGTEGIDTGDVIPTTPAQLEGLYPPNNTFLPPATTTLPSIKDIASAAIIAGTVNGIVNPPKVDTGAGGGGFAVVPVPTEWKAPPTYSQQFTPIDLNSLFTTANLLGGTQWQNLPPEIQFAPTIEALTNIISNGQTTTRN